MAMTYDFDIFDPSGRKPETSELAEFLASSRISSPSVSETVALFRDQKTVDALTRAPKELQDFFLQSGFGTNTYRSGAPRNRYPVQDEEARLSLIERLTENVVHFHLPPSEEGAASDEEFNLADFLHHLTEATPIEMEATNPVVDAISVPVAKEPEVADPTRPSMFPSLVGFGSRLLKSVSRSRSA